ncbi:RNA polymerase sigma factor [Roseiconus lacunae]|uniref:RNA polymerase sigma factor n=1 Tax=Roseiconus lacunae TaxID=2605694 RepID=UPI00190FA442|nr:sigma-70 family RNA polymerase sigma factor [Roseiconus lacunae]
MTATPLSEDSFRHEHARLVAILTCDLGIRHLADVEDAVQAAMLSAVERWSLRGTPENPSAWLYRVARNHLLGNLRKTSRRRQVLQNDYAKTIDSNRSNGSADDDEQTRCLLRMLFLCCDEVVPEESRLAFTLKTLCGFSVKEIAVRLFTNDENIYKRISRAKASLSQTRLVDAELSTENFMNRMPSVQRVLYLMFTEGYLSIDAESSIRSELCNEAIRLALVLASHRDGEHPETSALIALMLLNTARLNGRQDHAGGLLLLEEQDRTKWDQELIAQGMHWLKKSSTGEHFSRYHCEAGIAAAHCLSPSFTETRWDDIVKNYSVLASFVDVPVHRLNHALAIAENDGPAVGLEFLKLYQPPSWLAGSYMWSAVSADLYFRCGQQQMAIEFYETAIATAPTAAIGKLIQRRFDYTCLLTRVRTPPSD